MSGPKITMTSVRTRYTRAKTAGKITEYLQDYMDQVWDAAVRAFVLATARAMEADTGMSIASLFALAREVGCEAEVDAIMRSKRGFKGGSKPGISKAASYGMPSNAIPQKNIEAGDRLGQYAFAFLLGDSDLTRWVYRLRYTVNVLQWAFHEESWDALTAGREALESSFERNTIDLAPAQMQADYIQRGKVPTKISVNRRVNTYTGDEGEE